MTDLEKRDTARMSVGQDIPTKEETIATTKAETTMVEFQVASIVVTWGTLEKIALRRTKRGGVFTIGACECARTRML